LLSLLSEEKVYQRRFGSLVVPKDSDLRDIASVRRDLETLPQILGLAPKEVRARVVPFLDTLQSYAKDIPRDVNIAELMRHDTSNSSVMSALFAWSASQAA
jgi:hypothetical protein